MKRECSIDNREQIKKWLDKEVPFMITLKTSTMESSDAGVTER